MKRDMVSAGIVVVINLILDDPLFYSIQSVPLLLYMEPSKNNRILIKSLHFVKDRLCPTLCSTVSDIQSVLGAFWKQSPTCLWRTATNLDSGHMPILH